MNGLEFDEMMQKVLDAIAASQMDALILHLRSFMALAPCELDVHKIAPALAHAAFQDNAGDLIECLLNTIPSDWWLPWYFAQELHKHRVPEAQRFYEKALEFRPDSADLLGDYAHFLQGVLEAGELADLTFRRALDLEPENLTNLRRYAYFLRHFRSSPDEADKYAKRVAEVEGRK